jgi:aspartyl protease family protein
MNRVNYFFSFIVMFFALLNFTTGQTYVKMTQENGVFTVPCTVNGLQMNFIFDTGASNVSISLTEAKYMMKNGHLNKEDLVGATYFQFADGNISQGTKVVIRELKIGNRTLRNVEANVVHTDNAPLLLGQSALQRFGLITVDYSNKRLIISNSPSTEKPKAQAKIMLRDPDGNPYPTVKIGNQIWMAQNLRTSRYSDGSSIITSEINSDAELSFKPEWYWYNEDKRFDNPHGKLYNWTAVSNSRGLCPLGWRVPSVEDWRTLREAVSNSEEPKSGEALKSDFSWYKDSVYFEYQKKYEEFGGDPITALLRLHREKVPEGINGNGENDFGFNGLPSGYYNSLSDGDSVFALMGFEAFWWSTNSIDKLTAIHVQLSWGTDDLFLDGKGYKYHGFSVRCIKND